MRRVVFVVLMLIVAAGGGWLIGQQPTQTFVPPPPGLLTGADFGFRVESTTPTGIVLGTLMVRQKNGQWVEASTVRFDTHRLPLDR